MTRLVSFIKRVQVNTIDCATCAFEAAELSYYELYGTPDYVKTEEMLLIVIEKDDVYNLFAMQMLSELYILKTEEESKYPEAEKMLLELSEQEMPRAMLYLGVLYNTTQYGMKDEAKADEYFSMVFDAVKDLADTEPVKQYCFGMMYLYGFGVELDIVQAREYLNGYALGNAKQAEEVKQYLSDVALLEGARYLGIGNIADGIIKFTESAEAGNEMAMYLLGCIYSDEKYGCVNINKSIEWYEKGIAAGDMSCVHNLAKLYSEEKYGIQDVTKAVELYLESADKYGCDYCYSWLGILYSFDRYNMIDYDKAEEMYLSAAKLGASHAMVRLGVMYSQDKFGRLNLVKAEEYFLEAAENEEAAAMLWLAVLYRDMLPGGSDQDKYSEWIEKLQNILETLNDNDLTKQYCLGKMYLYGYGVEQNLELARHNLTAYADGGYVEEVSEYLAYIDSLEAAN